MGNTGLSKQNIQNIPNLGKKYSTWKEEKGAQASSIITFLHGVLFNFFLHKSETVPLNRSSNVINTFYLNILVLV